jgi:DNA-binding transcriptional MerR regulator
MNVFYTFLWKGGNTLDHHFYRIGQFAQKASVSLRTLRFYDKVGLLRPSGHTEAGYRLYTDADLFRLQQILALKFLGFSLEEIEHCLCVGPTTLREALALQKAMMYEKRAQLDTIIQAIDETAALLQGNGHDWEAIIHVIQVMHMQQANDWRKKYFTEEQLQQMEQLSEQYYAEEDRKKLAEWGKDWSEADQERANQEWGALIGELKRLVAAGADPTSPDAQTLAGQWLGMVRQFTRGHASITEGLKKMTAANLRGETPYSPFFGKEEGAFLEKMLTIYEQQHG